MVKTKLPPIKKQIPNLLKNQVLIRGTFLEGLTLAIRN